MHYYKQVIELLDNQLRRALKCMKAIQSWICGHHKLAEVFKEKEEIRIIGVYQASPTYWSLYKARSTQ